MSHPDPCKELQVFPRCELVKQYVVLWADAGDLPDLIHVIGVGHIISKMNKMLLMLHYRKKNLTQRFLLCQRSLMSFQSTC